MVKILESALNRRQGQGAALVEEMREDRGHMERLERKCADLRGLVAAAEGSIVIGS